MKIILSISISVLSLAAALIGAAPANAASIYDDAVRTTPTLSLINNAGSHNYSVIDNPSSSYYFDTLLSTCVGWSSSYTSGTFSLSQVISDFPDETYYGDYMVFATWSTSPTHPLSTTKFYDGGTHRAILAPDSLTGLATIRITSSGTPVVECSSYPISTGSRISSSNSFDGSGYPSSVYIYQSTYTVTYPTGYEGTPLPLVPESSAEDVDFSPDWYITQIFNNEGTFHDKNFNTFDANPFLCQEETAPVLHYEIWDITDGDLLIHSTYQSSTAPINYDFGQSDTPRNFKILGWYDCGEGSPYNFTETSELTFTINPNGMQNIDLMAGCIIETFPWVDPYQCIQNNIYITNLLIFGEIQLPTYEFDPSCHSLNTMDDWLGLPPTHVVCPQIPEEVRSITTPFVAFLLGLITLGFINKVRRDFDG